MKFIKTIKGYQIQSMKAGSSSLEFYYQLSIIVLSKILFLQPTVSSKIIPESKIFCHVANSHPARNKHTSISPISILENAQNEFNNEVKNSLVDAKIIFNKCIIYKHFIHAYVYKPSKSPFKPMIHGIANSDLHRLYVRDT